MAVVAMTSMTAVHAVGAHGLRAENLSVGASRAHEDVHGLGTGEIACVLVGVRV